MSDIFVFCEFANGQLKKGSLELLTAAQKAGGKVRAVALGSGAQGLVAQLGANGADEAFIGDNAAFDKYNPELFTQVVSEIFQKNNAGVVLASSTSLGRDLFPRVAAKLGAATISDCTDLDLSGGNVKVRRPMYSGKCSAAVELNAPTKIVLMRANQLPVAPANAGKTPQVHAVAAPQSNFKTLIKDIVKGTSEKLDLTEANIIVSGGRGMKEAANFKVLEELAEVLGATVGASRAVVDAGWVPHNMQVGQTGKTVAPTLYIAAGISGAIQHLAGMSGAKVIVAINKDANAPIFQKATYGIVGDALEIVPQLTQEFRKLLQH